MGSAIELVSVQVVLVLPMTENLVAHRCTRGAVMLLGKECIGCGGIDHRGRPRWGHDRLTQMEYQITYGDNGDVKGYVCREGCIKRAGAYNKYRYPDRRAKF